MHSFPFLQLPQLARINVLQNLDPCDLIRFSLLSKCTEAISISARLKLRMIYFHITGESIEIAIEGFHCPLLIVEFIREYPEDIPPFAVEFFKYLMTIFKVQGFDLVSKIPLPPDFFVFKHAHKFEKLELFGSIPESLLKFTLKNLETGWLRVSEKPTSDFRYSGPMTMRKLTAGYSEWLTLEALLSMECEDLKILHCHFGNSDLKEFFKTWMTGERLRKLKKVYLDIHREVDLDDIFDGLEAIPYTDPRSHWEGKLICREDGTRASVTTVCELTFFQFDLLTK